MQPLSLKALCEPRPVIFDPQKRDTVLDLSDLVEGRINPAEFFEENYITEGMKTLLEHAFRRLEGKSDQGVFKLKQAMGGGKTHNLLALGLLAQYPEYREQVMGDFYTPDPSLGPVKVIAFSGRETDAPYGLWGALAEQLGKKDLFKDLYSPLRAPGQKAWENLLRGERVLILLDELPPYFQNARSIQIGNSDLAEVTATALSNLLVAIGRPGCEHVALVITDLAAAYERGSAQISEVLRDFENETRRSAMTLEPVRLNSDELYHILRKRLFKSLPSEERISEVAQAYADALRKARQMNMTNETPEEMASRILEAYPFHPGIRDLYARFRENPGFQQTRGLIRLMRLVAANLWESGAADRQMLIHAHDIDLNNQMIRAEIGQINSTLENAIAHDIASEGNALAERLDNEYGTRDASDAARLLLMASLANVPNAVVGLAIPELIGYLAAPGRDLPRLKNDILPALASQAWYLHSTRDGKLYFKNVQNLNAKLETLVKTYVEEQAIKELRERLEALFEPQARDIYQKLLIFPAIDEIDLERDFVTLIITQPHAGGLNPALREFYEQTTWKNRILILTGPRNTYNQLLDVGKRLKAIQHILDELTAEGVPDKDPQMVQAKELYDRIRQNFLSTVRETFTTLWYPTAEGLMSADFHMRFQSNRYNGEEQIRAVLLEKMKFTTDTTSDTFRKKVERRLFTQQSMPWNEIKRRAATNPGWQWHIPTALDTLKEICISRDIWRENGGFVDKGPFPQPKTSVQVRELSRDDTTGTVTLRLTPIHGDTIYWEVGDQVSTASARLEGNTLTTADLRLSFLCVDSTGQHETGEPVVWQNRITLKYRIFQKGEDKMLELRAAPPADIFYTSDGSSPKTNGARYEGPFAIPRGATVVLAYAQRDGIESDVLTIHIDWDKTEGVTVDPRKPASLHRTYQTDSTQETYLGLETLRKFNAKLGGVTLTIDAVTPEHGWIELTAADVKQFTPDEIEQVLNVLRQLQGEGQVRLQAEYLAFPTGQFLQDWLAETKEPPLSPGEVKQ